MPATVSMAPKPPHLISHPAASAMPVAQASGSRAPTPTMGKAIKGFFIRSKSPVEDVYSESVFGFDQNARARLRSVMGDKTNSRPMSANVNSKPSAGRASEAYTPGDMTKTLRKGPDGKRLRPPSPESRIRRNIRFAPSDLPAMQMGADGKWQPPSLSRGSMSTSALELYALGDDDDPMLEGGGDTAQPSSPVLRKDEMKQEAGGSGAGGDVKGMKGTLSNLFSQERSTIKDEDIKTVTPAVKRDAAKSGADSRSHGERRQEKQMTSSVDASHSQNQSSVTQVASGGKGVSPPAPATSPKATSPSNTHRHHNLLGPGSTTDVTVPRARSPTTPAWPISSAARAYYPTHARANSEPLLSVDHYTLRLSTSYLIKALVPLLRGSILQNQVSHNEKAVEMRRMANDHLAQLERMERVWGGEWMRVAGGAQDLGGGREVQGGAVGIGIEGEARIRAIQVGARTKERERRVWKEAIRDGVLLCFLFNHLFSAQPPHIPRVNISEDGILRATNITRIITACQAVGLCGDEIFGLADLEEGSESGLSRVAGTVLALARKSGRSPSGRPGSPLHPSVINASTNTIRPGSPTSRHSSRPTSRSPSVVPPSPPGSPRRASLSPSSPSRRGSTDSRLSTDAANDLHSKLQTLIPPSKPASPVATPPGSKLLVHPRPAVTPTRPASAVRSATQPNLSPTSLRPKSPPGTPSRSRTPSQRSSSISVRPALRPRQTTGSSRTQTVSFASREGEEGGDAFLPPGAAPPTRTSFDRADRPPGVSLHKQERTPSLISSGSRVTSGYTHSSAVFSVDTVTGDDHSHAVDLAETDEAGGLEDGPMGSAWGRWGRERRASEKTLQVARQKILDTLLQQDPYSGLRSGATTPTGLSDDLRDQAISQSLAALEGESRPYSAPGSIPGSPRRLRPNRSYSIELERQQVDRLSEGDEGSGGSLSGNSKTPTNETVVTEEKRPSLLLRRTSTNASGRSNSGRIYVPKRSTSPTPTRPISPISIPPPSTQISFYPQQPLQPEGAHPDFGGPSSSRMERRQSDIHPRPLQPPGTGVYLGGGASGRVTSMVNLSTSRYSGMSRDSEIGPSSVGSQVLEFEEPGMPVMRYQLGNCVGRGQFGSVYRSLNLVTGQMAAIKRIRLHGMKEDEVKEVMREVELLKRLSHPSIVKYEGMSRDEDYLNIVLEFVENGSLGQTIKAFGRLNERLVASYVGKILEGLDYLHSEGVVHCDLKAANILSTKTGNVKLSDFGVSLNMKAVENFKQDAETRSKAGPAGKGGPSRSDVAGTPNWMAPEVISLNGAGPASDIWSLGCTIIELLTGKPPYADILNSMTVLFRIVEDEMPPLPPVSPALEDFLTLCFIKDPKFRPSAAVLFEHSWMRSANPELQLLRPQDSVPFLRRMCLNSGRADSSDLFANAPPPSTASAAAPSTVLSVMNGNVDGRRLKRISMASSYRSDITEGDGKHAVAHTFIKTSFGQGVKKSGVLCQACGLIAHSSCANTVSPRCNAHAQLAQYVQQQEQLHSATSSRQISPQVSFDNDIPRKTRSNLPGKILQGLRRSKSAATSTSSVNLREQASGEGDMFKRSGSRSVTTGPIQEDPSRHLRPYDQPSARLYPTDSRDRRRASMMSDISMSTATDCASAMDHSQYREEHRPSTIHFDLDQRVGQDKHVGKKDGPSSGKGATASGVGNKNKSDCTIQ